jgi:hypothetical protein
MPSCMGKLLISMLSLEAVSLINETFYMSLRIQIHNCSKPEGNRSILASNVYITVKLL